MHLRKGLLWKGTNVLHGPLVKQSEHYGLRGAPNLCV